MNVVKRSVLQDLADQVKDRVLSILELLNGEYVDKRLAKVRVPARANTQYSENNTIRMRCNW